MGVCSSSMPAGSTVTVQQQAAQQKRVANSIDAQIRDDRKARLADVKLLLLGAGECGKTTIVKQMKILHHKGFSEIEVQQQRTAVFTNTVLYMAELLTAMRRLDLQLEHSDQKVHAVVILEEVKRGPERDRFSGEVYRALKSLWQDGAVQEAYERRHQLHLPDSAKYFLDAVDRLNAPDYKPTDQDILFTRVRTTGIVEVCFLIKNLNFRVVDVGGQRSERRKWIHCFAEVNAIIFICAINEYDQLLVEDNKTNRLLEALKLFGSVNNSVWFRHTNVILFLNKTDLFAKKIQLISLKVCFPDYNGMGNYQTAVSFIEDKFDEQNHNRSKTMYMHQTCATDTNQVQMVLDSVTDMIVQHNAKGVNLY